MLSFWTRAGLGLGAIALAFSAPARADDLRGAQSLVEAGVFLAHAETEAAFSRLDAERKEKAPVTELKTFVDLGAASFGQAERGERLGYGGNASQFRVGVDREVSNGVVLGAMTASGVGEVSSGDLVGGTLSQHVDVYGRVQKGSAFAKLLFGGSVIGFRAIDRGPDESRSRGRAIARNARVAAQAGATFDVEGVKVSPSIGVGLYANALSGYREHGGATNFSYRSRLAQAAIGSFRLKAARSFKVDPTHAVKLEAFVGADEMLAFDSTPLRASTAAGASIRQSWKGAPTGRGVVGGLGVGTSLAEGVDLNFGYDYGSRDGFATHAARGRLGVSF
ncbi:autotransporter domain-containing protein [Methylopila turkensis]|uniref:Autotransporter domain-containing protein n=1 Tax=Methylopila turkensis TaxID=1437816 RepID=A0A9W6N6T6_9HYPH|nr:autotransporter domain-containing protein [Methylopila turkensis]GLK79690.1 hypothetical protein GCM10008174_14310 [Methylopila turkensis]